MKINVCISIDYYRNHNVLIFFQGKRNGNQSPKKRKADPESSGNEEPSGKSAKTSASVSVANSEAASASGANSEANSAGEESGEEGIEEIRDDDNEEDDD